MKILQVGCGKMGSALLHRWLSLTAYDFTVVAPSLKTPPKGAQGFNSADALPEGAYDLIIIALKPQMISDVMPTYASKRAPQGAILSMAAGTSCESLKQACDTATVMRIMPNLPVMIGEGMSGLYAAPECGQGHRDLVQSLAAATGEYLWAKDENELDKLTAVAGSGPGFVFEITRLYVKAAMRLGFDAEIAQRLVLQTMRGTTGMALEMDQDLETLRNSVTSKNGTTEAGLKHLAGAGTLETLLNQTLQGAYDRAVELR